MSDRKCVGSELDVDPFQLVLAGQYEEAIREYSKRFESTARSIDLNNRALAYLLSGDYDRALQDYQLSLRDDPRLRSAKGHLMTGVCHWYLDQPARSVTVWRDGLSAPYADAAGGIEIPAVLYYAGLRLDNPDLRDEGASLLKEHWTKFRRRERRKRKSGETGLNQYDLIRPGLIAWPGAIVPFLLGHVDQVELYRCAERPSAEVLSARWRCAADFYTGVRALAAGDSDQYLQSTRRCAASRHGVLEHEYHLARWELRTRKRRPKKRTRPTDRGSGVLDPFDAIDGPLNLR